MMKHTCLNMAMMSYSNNTNITNKSKDKTVGIRDAYDLVRNLPNDLQKMVGECWFERRMLPSTAKTGYVVPFWWPVDDARRHTIGNHLCIGTPGSWNNELSYLPRKLGHEIMRVGKHITNTAVVKRTPGENFFGRYRLMEGPRRSYVELFKYEKFTVLGFGGDHLAAAAAAEPKDQAKRDASSG